jgi:hypothetical protein
MTCRCADRHRDVGGGQRSSQQLRAASSTWQQRPADRQTRCGRLSSVLTSPVLSVIVCARPSTRVLIQHPDTQQATARALVCSREGAQLRLGGCVPAGAAEAAACRPARPADPSLPDAG